MMLVELHRETWYCRTRLLSRQCVLPGRRNLLVDIANSRSGVAMGKTGEESGAEQESGLELHDGLDKGLKRE